MLAPDPKEDLNLLIDAAEAAGIIAERHWRTDHRTWDKGDGQGPVTEADLEVDEMLRSRLTHARPNYGWMSEETPDIAQNRMAADRAFVIDPIDGTRAFVDGHRTWAHSLAVVEAGRVTAAVVYLPLRDKIYTAAIGQGSALNGTQISASTRTETANASVLLSKPALAAHHWRGQVPALARHYRPSLAYRLALVAEGRFDGLLTLRYSWEWDTAAGSLLVQEAGGIAVDRLDKPLSFNSASRQSAGIIAGAPNVVKSLAAQLATS